MDLAVYAHPLLMLGVLGFGLFVLREGLRIRRGRIHRRPVPSAVHRRAGKWFVGLATLGALAGLGSLAGLVGKPVLESVHALVAGTALAGFWAGGALGLWLERDGRAPIRSLHAALAGLGLLAGLGAGIAGWAILP